ncbi:MAG: tyrosine-type recombinase/integrase [Myxococcota bacterium]
MTTTLADMVGQYVAYTREIYESREWMNIRAAVARLVPHVRELDRRSIRLALDELELERQLSQAYRRQVWNRWRRFIRWAVEREHAPAMLAFEISTLRPRFAIERRNDLAAAKHPEEPLNFERVRRVLAHLPQPARDLMELLALTGARPGELCHLRSQDLDLVAGIAVLDQHKNAHRKLHRQLALPIAAVSILQNRWTPFTPGDWLFPAPRDRSRPVRVDVVAQQLQRTLRRQGQPRFMLYDIRRLCARTLRANASLDHAQALLGHATTRTTEIYAPRREHPRPRARTMSRSSKGYAPAKAKLVTRAMRAAGAAGAPPQAQALLANLIGEAWPEGDYWVARIGWPVLERRLNSSRSSVKRWAAELDRLNLVQRIPGDGRDLSQWGIFQRASRESTHEPPGGAPMNPGESTHEPPGGAPVNPVSGSTQDLTQEPADVADELRAARDVDAGTPAQRLAELRRLTRPEPATAATSETP